MQHEPPAAGTRGFSLRWLAEEPQQAVRPPTPLAATEVQLCVATSGSSGSPRIARHTGDSLAAGVTASMQRTGLRAGDLWANCLPMTHIGGLAVLLRCLHAGASMLIFEGFDADSLWTELSRRPVTHLSLVPAMLARLLCASDNAQSPPALRCVLIGGGPLSAELARRALSLGWPLVVSYGMSETASHITTCVVTDKDWAPGIVGTCLDGASITVVDAQGQPTAGTGRIRISGPMVMQGYADHTNGMDAGGSRRSFTSNDLGYLDDQGRLHLSGRADQLLNSGGYSIDPEQLEAELKHCPGVEQAAVSSVGDTMWGDRLVALVTGPVNERKLQHWCRQHLPGYRRPRLFIKVERLPCTASGKLDRPALARLAAALTNNDPA